MSTWTSNIYKALKSLTFNEFEVNTLSQYDFDAVCKTNDICRQIDIEIDRQKDPEAILALKLYSKRLKDGLNLYTRTRLLKIMDLKGNIRGQLPQHIKKSLSQQEVEFLSEYRSAVSVYSRELDFDPSAGCCPPKGLNVSCTALKNAESIMVGENCMTLKKGSTLELRAQEAIELESLGLVRIEEYIR